MYKSGYKKISNIDISEVVIEQMYKMQKLKNIRMQCINLLIRLCNGCNKYVI